MAKGAVMTPKEFKVELRKIAAEIGPGASLSAHISDYGSLDGVLYCGVYPHGHGKFNNYYFSVEADDFPELLARVRAKWAEMSAQAHKEIVRKMALAVIRLTAELGQCTDAALRQEFPGGQVKMYGADACTEANALAERGPFTIVHLGGGNGAPAELDQVAGAQS